MRSSIGRILRVSDPMSSSDPSMSVPNPGQREESLPEGAHLCSSGYTGDHSLFSNAGSWLRSPTSLPWDTRFWQSTTGTNICCYLWQNVMQSLIQQKYSQTREKFVSPNFSLKWFFFLSNFITKIFKTCKKGEFFCPRCCWVKYLEIKLVKMQYFTLKKQNIRVCSLFLAF